MAIDDGGPAFPQLGRNYEDYFNVERGRTEMRENIHTSGGMSLRDYLAAKAMATYLRDDLETLDMAHVDEDLIADCAYSMADAMLRARAAGKEQS